MEYQWAVFFPMKDCIFEVLAAQYSYKTDVVGNNGERLRSNKII